MRPTQKETAQKRTARGATPRCPATFFGLRARPVRFLAFTTSAALLCLLQAGPSPAQPPARAQTGPARSTPASDLRHAAPKGKAAVKHFSIYALDIPNTKVAFSVYLNDWFIDGNDGGAPGYFSSSLVGDSVADGQNTVSIHLTAPAHGAPPVDRFRVRIRSSEGEVFSFDWEPNDPKRPLPFQAEGHFEAHLPTGPWAWQTAPRITLDAPTKAGISAFVKRLFDALNAKNVDEATALFAPRARDNSLSRNVPAAEADAGLRAGWVKTFATPGWRMDPVDYAHLKYDLFESGRVVQVSRADDTYVLRDDVGKPEDPHKSYALYFCLVKGQWTLIR